ncbi:OprD family outer membrane porin [Pelobacter seleniigenes]|uniref:OprD family outer membrane porin n=1 Tax=Pelobacter seleniigenes TaxID=407188 RepID=UPI0004A6E0A5|nr:OprD family outer membrane porin [Pelobacter seleniigenes]
MKAKLFIVALLSFGLANTAMAAENLKEMFAQGSLKGEISLMNFTRDFKNGTKDNQDTALGGAFYYRTDSFKGISLGLAVGTTNGIGDYEDKGTYYGLTAPPDHANVTRLQEYYLQAHYFDTTIKVGAQEVNTPFLNIHPIRMIHRSYRGLSVVNKSVKDLTLMGYYLKDNLGWVDEEFVSFTDDVYIAGAAYKLPVEAVNTKVQAWYFTMPDSFNQTYFKVDFSKKMADYVLHAAPTFFTQKSQGDELDGELDTYQYGFNAGVSAFGFDLTGFYAKTGDDSIRDPWGYGKIIIQQVVNSGDSLSGDRSDEDAYALRLSYDFSKVGVKGLDAYVFYALYDAPASTINETDFSVQYAFSGALEGLSARARYAIVDKDSGQEDLDDIRLYLTYKFAFDGK